MILIGGEGSCRNVSNKSVKTVNVYIESVSMVSLWLYCNQFGVNSHSVAVIATDYPVAITTPKMYNLAVYKIIWRPIWVYSNSQTPSAYDILTNNVYLKSTLLQ